MQDQNRTLIPNSPSFSMNLLKQKQPPSLFNPGTGTKRPVPLFNRGVRITKLDNQEENSSSTRTNYQINLLPSSQDPKDTTPKSESEDKEVPENKYQLTITESPSFNPSLMNVSQDLTTPRETQSERLDGKIDVETVIVKKPSSLRVPSYSTMRGQAGNPESSTKRKTKRVTFALDEEPSSRGSHEQTSKRIKLRYATRKVAAPKKNEQMNLDQLYDKFTGKKSGDGNILNTNLDNGALTRVVSEPLNTNDLVPENIPIPQFIQSHSSPIRVENQNNIPISAERRQMSSTRELPRSPGYFTKLLPESNSNITRSALLPTVPLFKTESEPVRLPSNNPLVGNIFSPRSTLTLQNLRVTRKPLSNNFETTSGNFMPRNSCNFNAGVMWSRDNNFDMNGYREAKLRQIHQHDTSMSKIQSQDMINTFDTAQNFSKIYASPLQSNSRFQVPLI